MNMLLDTLDQVGAHPATWGVIAALGLFASVSLYGWLVCPYSARRATISREAAREALSKPFIVGPRYVIAMIAGIAAMLTGLWMIAQAINPPLAFALVVAGLFVVQTEPARLRLREAVNRTIAAELAGAEAQLSAQERLRYSHLWLVSLHFLLLVAVTAGVLAF